MERAFTQGEYWILSSAVELKYPLTWLADPHLEAHFNRRTHGLDAPALLDTLERLFSEGLLEAERWTSREPVPRLGALSREQIRLALEPNTIGDLWYAHYGLTPEGGAAWESFARPRWDSFLGEEWSADDPTWRTVTCMDRRYLDHFRRSLALYEQYDAPVKATVEETGPWAATYWKTLPTGFRVTYQYPPEWEEPPIAGPEWQTKWLMFLGLCSMRKWWCPWA